MKFLKYLYYQVLHMIFIWIMSLLSWVIFSVSLIRTHFSNIQHGRIQNCVRQWYNTHMSKDVFTYFYDCLMLNFCEWVGWRLEIAKPNLNGFYFFSNNDSEDNRQHGASKVEIFYTRPKIITDNWIWLRFLSIISSIIMIFLFFFYGSLKQYFPKHVYTGEESYVGVLGLIICIISLIVIFINNKIKSGLCQCSVCQLDYENTSIKLCIKQLIECLFFGPYFLLKEFISYLIKFHYEASFEQRSTIKYQVISFMLDCAYNLILVPMFYVYDYLRDLSVLIIMIFNYFPKLIVLFILLYEVGFYQKIEYFYDWIWILLIPITFNCWIGLANTTCHKFSKYISYYCENDSSTYPFPKELSLGTIHVKLFVPRFTRDQLKYHDDLAEMLLKNPLYPDQSNEIFLCYCKEFVKLEGAKMIFLDYRLIYKAFKLSSLLYLDMLIITFSIWILNITLPPIILNIIIGLSYWILINIIKFIKKKN
jgi:hypothetical protein